MNKYAVPAVMLAATVLLAAGALHMPDTQPIGAPRTTSLSTPHLA